jgi:hypothetical protein
VTTATHIRPVSADLPVYPIGAQDPGTTHAAPPAALALHDGGATYEAIGRAIGLSWWTAKRIVRAACKARAAGGAA